MECSGAVGSSCVPLCPTDMPQSEKAVTCARSTVATPGFPRGLGRQRRPPRGETLTAVVVMAPPFSARENKRGCSAPSNIPIVAWVQRGLRTANRPPCPAAACAAAPPLRRECLSSSPSARLVLSVTPPLPLLKPPPDHPERPARVRAIMNALTRNFPEICTMLAPEATVEQVRACCACALPASCL